MAGLLLLGGRVITMDPAHPLAEAVALRDGRIVAVGAEAECRQAVPSGARVLNVRGRTVVPGFVDAHIHLAAYAASLRAVDCSPAAVGSIDEIVRRLREQASALPPGAWVRAAGYDETALAEGRHPTRWELDAASADRPIRLLHRSGHAAVLNSAGLALAGITIASEEPPGAVIDRRLSDGEPSGLLLEMNDVIARAVPPLPRAELVAGLCEASARLVRAGVTAVQDMSHTNGGDADGFLHALAAESEFAPRLLPVAEGWDAGRGAHPDGGWRPVKVMVREAAGRPRPDSRELAAVIAACARVGRQVAVHAIEERTVEAVVSAFERAGSAARIETLRHRIEHAAVCPPDLARRIAHLGLTVVSNPGFLWYGGDRYLRRVPPADLPYLYAAGELHDAGVRMAAGSDAPVEPPDPLTAIRAAVDRRTASGMRLPGRGLAPHAALALWTVGAAAAAHSEQAVGRVAPGMGAGLVVLTAEPGADGVAVEMTIVDGTVRWERDGADGGRPSR